MGFFDSKKKQKPVEIPRQPKSPTNSKQHLASVEQGHTIRKQPPAATNIHRRPVNGELNVNPKLSPPMRDQPARPKRLQPGDETLLSKQRDDAESKRNQDHLRLQVSELLKRLQDSSEEVARLQRSVTSLQGELHSARSTAHGAVGAARAELKAKNEELSAKARELEAVNESHDQAKLRLNQTRVELANEQRTARQATQKLADLSRQFEFVQQQCARLQERLTSSLAQRSKRVNSFRAPLA